MTAVVEIRPHVISWRNPQLLHYLRTTNQAYICCEHTHRPHRSHCTLCIWMNKQQAISPGLNFMRSHHPHQPPSGPHAVITWRYPLGCCVPYTGPEWENDSPCSGLTSRTTFEQTSVCVNLPNSLLSLNLQATEFHTSVTKLFFQHRL